LRIIANVDAVVGSAAGRECLREERVVVVAGGVELEGLSRIGDSDDPLAEGQ
jgi:hypothetical protein